MPDPRCPHCREPVPGADDFTIRAEASRVGAHRAEFYACGVHAACCEPLIVDLKRRSERSDWRVEVTRTPGR